MFRVTVTVTVWFCFFILHFLCDVLPSHRPPYLLFRKYYKSTSIRFSIGRLYFRDRSPHFSFDSAIRFRRYQSLPSHRYRYWSRLKLVSIWSDGTECGGFKYRAREIFVFCECVMKVKNAFAKALFGVRWLKINSFTCELAGAFVRKYFDSDLERCSIVEVQPFIFCVCLRNLRCELNWWNNPSEKSVADVISQWCGLSFFGEEMHRQEILIGGKSRRFISFFIMNHANVTSTFILDLFSFTFMKRILYYKWNADITQSWKLLLFTCICDANFIPRKLLHNNSVRIGLVKICNNNRVCSI